VDGFAPHRIRSILDLAIRRFHAFSRLQTELSAAQSKLAERESVDKAKRILMQTRRLSEPDAYAELRKTAMNQGKRIAEIADAVVTAHKLMGGAA
jgi:response regulator NasT